MSHKNSWAVSSIFIISDIAIFYGVFRLSAILRIMLVPLLGGNLLWQNVAHLAQLGILLGMVFFISDGLYPGFGLTGVKELQRIIKSVTLVFLFLTVASYLNKPFQGLSRVFLLFSWFLALVMLPVSHFIIRKIISRFAWYGTPVVVFGDGAWTQHIVKSLKQAPRLGWCPTLVLPLDAIKRGMQLSRFDIAIFSPPPGLPEEKYERLLNQNFRKVIVVRQTDSLGSVWVEPHEIDGQLGLEFHYNLLDSYAGWIKRLMDLGLGLALIILLSPLILILCLLIVLDSPGPILFYQERIGKGFKRFKIIKFRTMAVDAEQRLNELLQKDPVALAEYEKFHKFTNDPRLTRLGKWLRRFSLDELPQLWNTLKGDMSLVGPRAYMKSELIEVGNYAPTILRVKPGMTGWWQVMGRHEITFQQRVRMDEYYISNWSLWMDIYILLKTVWVVESGKGA